MAHSGKQKAFDPNANRPLPSRPLPLRWEHFQPTEMKLNNRKRIITPSAENTSTALPTIPNICEDIQNHELSTYENVLSVEGQATSEAKPRADTDAEPKRKVEANAEQRRMQHRVECRAESNA